MKFVRPRFGEPLRSTVKQSRYRECHTGTRCHNYQRFVRFEIKRLLKHYDLKRPNFMRRKWAHDHPDESTIQYKRVLNRIAHERRLAFKYHYHPVVVRRKEGLYFGFLFGIPSIDEWVKENCQGQWRYSKEWSGTEHCSVYWFEHPDDAVLCRLANTE